METTGRQRIATRKSGMAIVLAGALILAFVFMRAYYLFAIAAPALRLGRASSGASVMGMPDAAFTLVAQVGLLIVMTIAGSIIASRGVQLYRGRAEQARL